jgi:hypothetical protein
MITLAVVVLDELVDSPSEPALSERNYAGETLFLDGTYESLA